MSAVLLPVGRDLYAVPIAWVRHVMVAPRVAALVTAPAVVLGLFNMRGEIVSLLDTAALLGIGQIESAAFVVVLGTPDGPVALSASSLPERVTLRGPANESALPGTSGTFSSAGRVVVLLDPAVLLATAGLGPSGRPRETGAAAVT